MKIEEQQVAVDEMRHFISIFSDSEGSIKPHFALIGPSGTGKTYNLKTVADEYNVGFIEINASGITREGVSGNSISKAMGPLISMANKPVLIFVDEFDKTLMKSGGLTEGAYADLQFEFLKMLEPDGTVDVFADYGKYVSVNTSRCLFVFGGAFGGAEITCMEDLSHFGLRAEFMGRVGQLVLTDRVSKESLLSLVPKSKLMEGYLDLFRISKQKAIMGIQSYIDAQYEGSVIGVRLVETCVHQYFLGVDPTLRKKPTQKPPRKARPFKGVAH